MPSWMDVYPFLFETTVAHREDDVRTSQHLRYAAYCLDKAFLDPRDYPEEREVDEDDARSVHALLRFRPTRAPVGSIRLILPPGSFPVERVAGRDVSRALERVERDRIGEISRMCLTRRYLPATGVVRATYANDDPESARAMSYAILSLFRAIVSLSRTHGIEHWCGMMSPSILRGARRLGVHFHEIGPRLRFFGVKQPIVGAVDSVLETMRKERPELWKIATAPLEPDLWESPAPLESPGQQGAWLAPGT